MSEQPGERQPFVDHVIDIWRIYGDELARVNDEIGIAYIDGLADRYGIDLEQSVTEALELVKKA